MVRNGLNIEKIIAFRRNVHEYPELGYEEVETQRKIKEHLLEFGI